MRQPINRRRFLKGLVLGGGVMLAARRAGSAAESGSPPNILFIYTDDQSFHAIRALGCDEINTPNLDRLVRRGVTFTHCYNQGAWHGAVCVASRTMLHTGRFLWHAKALEPRLKDEIRAGRLWPQTLSDAGYDTYMSGKWHMSGCAPRDVFSVVKDVRGAMPTTVAEAYNRPPTNAPDPWQPWDRARGGYWQGDRHASEVLADNAIEFFGRIAQRQPPFFMYLAFNAPHDPRQAPREYVDMYPPEKIKVPENFLPEYPYKDAMGCPPTLRDEGLAPFPRTEHAVRVHRSEYYAIITHLDAQIGRILDALERSGRAANTWIFFTSDNGLAVGQHGLFGKQSMFEHSMRVPLIVCGPGIGPDRRISAPVYLQDIMPTTLELAGVPVPEHVQFRGLLPLVDGRRTRNYEAIYGAFTNEQRMVRVDGFKLIYYPKIDKTLLFDLNADPHEMRDLAEEPGRAPQLAALKHQLRELQRQTGDTTVKIP